MVDLLHDSVIPCGTTAQEIVDGDLDYICENLAREFAQMAGHKLLITGGGGFLGYYLVQSVLHYNRSAVPSQQIQLTVHENGIRGFPAWLERLEGVEVLRRDVVEPLPEDTPDFEFIIHAAGIASPTYYRIHPIETMDTNVTGLRILLDYTQRQLEAGKPMKAFLYFSTSEIYGDPDPAHIPTSETYRGNVSCTGTRACYDESKRYGETLCVNFAKLRGVPVKIARPFNNYGPGLKITDRRIVPDLVRDILNNRDIVLLSDGSPRRTFCYSADAVIGYYKILINGHLGEPYNIGTETPEVSMAELAEVLRSIAHDLCGYQGKVVLAKSADPEYLLDNPQRRCPVIAKARRELGYSPAICLREGLTRTLQWYRENQVGTEQ